MSTEDGTCRLSSVPFGAAGEISRRQPSAAAFARAQPREALPLRAAAGSRAFPPPHAALAAGFAGERPGAPGTPSAGFRPELARPARRVLRCGDPATARGCPPCPARRALRTPEDVHLPGGPAACSPGCRVRLLAFRTSPARLWLIGGASSPGPPVPPVRLGATAPLSSRPEIPASSTACPAFAPLPELRRQGAGSPAFTPAGPGRPEGPGGLAGGVPGPPVPLSAVMAVRRGAGPAFRRNGRRDRLRAFREGGEPSGPGLPLLTGGPALSCGFFASRRPGRRR
jgi:hypothetical protein